MPRNKKKPSIFPAKVSLSEFIGSRRDYYFIAVNTNIGMPALSNRISNILKKNVSYIGDYDLEESEKNAKFRMCYAPIDEEAEISLVIFENKTERLDQNFTAKSEVNAGFRTLSLFDDTYYIFNRNGLKLFYWDLLEVDYLLIIFANKGNLMEETLDTLKKIPECKCTDVTDLLRPDASSSQPENKFIQKLLYQIGMEISDFREENTNRIFVSKPQLSDKNISYSKMAFDCQANPKYLDLLQNDQTFI